MQIRAGLECNFANTELVDYKPSKACFDEPAAVNNTHCPSSGAMLVSGGTTTVFCVCCGRSFGAECVQNEAPVLQIGHEDHTKICTDCHNAQCCLVWLKSVVYVHTLALHELTPEVLRRVDRFKASFRLRRRTTPRLDMAASLKEQQQVNDIEFEELRRVDHEYRREGLQEEYDKLEATLDALGNDMQSLLGFLRAPTKGDIGTTVGCNSTGQCVSENMINNARLYFLVVRRLLRVADQEPDLLDFFWPQVLQIHLLLAKRRSLTSVALTDMLQQGIVSIALRYPHLALKLSWAVLATIGDYAAKRITQSQYAACVCMLLQLEVETYGVASSITNSDPSFSSSPTGTGSAATATTSGETGDGSVGGDTPVPTPVAWSFVSDGSGEGPVVRDGRSVLQRLLQGSSHQNQELTIELYTLLRVRKRLLSVQENDMAHRRAAASRIAPRLTPPITATEEEVGEGKGSNAEEEGGDVTYKERLEGVGAFEVDSETTVDQNTSLTSTDMTEFTCESIFLNKYPSPGGSEEGFCAVWKGLSTQLDFIEKITDLVDTLRFVDRPLRTDTLKAELSEKFVHEDGTLRMWGLDPTGAAAEPTYRMNRVYVDECRVFRTKARAPSLIVFEVVLDNVMGLASNVIDRDLSVSRREEGESQSGHYSHRRGHCHASLVGGGAVRGGDVDVSDMLEERLLKTKADMSRERSLSEAEEEATGQVVGDRSCGHSCGEHVHDEDMDETCRVEVENTTAYTPSPSVRAQSGSATRRLSSRGTGTSPPLSGGTMAIVFPNDEGNEDDVDIDPLLADGLPDEEAEVTKRVIESAMNLLASGSITQEEYAQLVQSNCKYRDEAKSNYKEQARAKIEFYYGEEWAARKERLLQQAGGDNRGTTGRFQAGNDAVWSVREESVRNRSRTRSRSIPSGVSGLDSIASEETVEDDSPPDDGDMNGMGSFPLSKRGTSEESGFEDSGVWAERDLRSFIVKSNDDLRQEVACIQLIELCQEIFTEAHLDNTLWLKPYRIVSTGPSAGFVETLPNTQSIDAIKKTEGFESLPVFFEQLYGGSAQTLHVARMNYVASLAAYSLVCYLFCIKDRHNGNILLDSEGHLVHIDFGFLLGIAPGGSFSVETAPFKLTDEMLDIFGGMESPYFPMFIKAFTYGFLALRAKASAIVSAVELMAQDSPFPCFQGKDAAAIVDKLRARLRNDLNETDTVAYCLDLITQSYGSLGTKQYDTYQWYTNGIVP